MKVQLPRGKSWWKYGVFYHIYPRSFFDSNEDGIGDIPGILQKLEYLEYLGADAIWLSPVFKSSQKDFGYDVTDYCTIDPVFGTLHDLKVLLKSAHKKNIRVILDLVMNHTSNQHPWFRESSSSLDNPKRDWYIWKTGAKGRYPNNWRNCFGQRAWKYDEKSGHYYFHSFFSHQPDLNWRNEKVQEAFFDIMKFWLEMGVDGFRLDVANLIVKDKKFRNNPVFFPFRSRQQLLYTRNRKRSLEIYKEIRRFIDNYEGRILVGEIYTMPPGDPGLAARYLGSGKDALHMTFDFSLIFRRWNAKSWARAIAGWYDAIPEQGWPCNVLSNHDLLRFLTGLRLEFSDTKKPLLQHFCY